jgi:hypothetical protein
VFKQNIKAVYIRQTGKHKKTKVEEILKNKESLNAETCYIEGSSKAIGYSKKNGLI